MSNTIGAGSSQYRNTAVLTRVFVVLLLAAGAVIMTIPFLWMVLTSFKTYPETLKVPIQWLPDTWMFDNFRKVLNDMSFGKYYVNTLQMTILSVGGQLFFCSLAAYAFARLRFPGKNLLFSLLLIVFMVPSQMTIIPKYLLMVRLSWIDSMKALVLPNIFSVFTVFMLRQFFATLSGELEDAAKIDGCSPFRTYWSIMLPLTKTALITVGVLNTLAVWNDLLWPLIVVSGDRKRVLSVALAVMQGQHGARNNLLMAGSVLATLPTLLIYVLGQKHITIGIANTGIKG